jgi:nucleoside phosphorylase
MLCNKGLKPLASIRFEQQTVYSPTMDSVFPEVSSVEISKLLILVPQGAEYQAVVGAIKNIPHPPVILAIPVGKLAVTKYLHDWRQNNPDFSPTGVMLMGLGGSLSAEFGLGQAVLLESCLNYQNNQADQEKKSDRLLNHWIQEKLGKSIRRVQGLTSDRVITEASEKKELGKSFNRQVAEMEGWAVLNFFSELGIPATIIRVISDDVEQSLPDLSKIYNDQGQLNAIALSLALGKKPIAGYRLIVGSLKSLKILNQITRKLFFSSIKPKTI